MSNKFIDMEGMQFGRLTVIKRVPTPKHLRVTHWECRCECGNLITTSRPNLITGHTTSCGCYALETKIGNKHRETHNESRTRLYHIWQSMKQRCYDKNHEGYEWYGGRDIKIYDEWMEYINFSKWAKANGYKTNLTIDRIDVNGNYEPNNCRWATIKQQNRNKTTTRYIELDGTKKSLGEWSEILDIPMNTIINRLDRGCDAKEALDTNYKRRRKCQSS